MRTFALAWLIAAFGCGVQSPPTPPLAEDISQEEFLANPPAGVLILDVRRPDEFGAGHVPNALNIPHDELESRLPELESRLDRPVLVYCERGGRAGQAASILRGAGYQRVLHLAGDMSEWRANGRPTVKP